MQPIPKILMISCGASLAMVTLLTACKQKNADSAASGVKTLDGLVAGEGGKDEPTYRCGIGYDGRTASLPAYVAALQPLIEPADSPLKDEFLGAAVALPGPIAQLLVATKTRIRLVPAAVVTSAEECGGTPFTRDQGKLNSRGEAQRSCWRQRVAGDRPEMILAADAAVLRSSVVRLGFYVYTELWLDRILGSSALLASLTPVEKTTLANVATARQNIGRALLVDLKKSDAAVYARFKTFSDVDATQFANIALAEAGDSYYCSSASRATFQKSFDATWKAFTATGSPNAAAQLFGTR